MKILDYIYNKLKAKAFQEKHKVTQLNWKKAELERRIALAKKERGIAE